MQRFLHQAAPLDWDFDPIEALQRWPMDQRVVLLNSGRFEPPWSRWSLLAVPVASYRFCATSSAADKSDASCHGQWIGPDVLNLAASLSSDPFADLQLLLRSTDGLWVGHLSYDLGRWIEELSSRAAIDRDWPIIELGYCPGFLLHDAGTKKWHACGSWKHGGWPVLDQVNKPASASSNQVLDSDDALSFSQPRSVFTQREYEKAVAKVLDYISAGDVFQVNLAQRLTAQTRGNEPRNHRHFYQRLARQSPAWYGAYLELSHETRTPSALHRVMASISPELFLQVRDKYVITRPIKGTRPSPHENNDSSDLATNPKDLAELNMIVDLLRNDLGRACAMGSIRVMEQRCIERHPTVFHAVATIQGKIAADKNIVDLLRATLPGGSITGAPKIRAMEIIDELEPVRRGPYCGCIGFLSREQSCLNITIRTLLLEHDPRTGNGLADFSVGGGIVADSLPHAEYLETLDKAAAILKAISSTTEAPNT